MKLPELAIDNRSFTWMVFIFLTILGVRSLITMPRTENPEVTVPGSSIIVLMPGAGPLDMESLVALPLEEAINELDDIKRIITDVRDGIAVISVEFEFNTDADEKYDEVVQQVNSIRNTLPDEILQLETWQWSISDMSMMLLALVSEDAPYHELEQTSEELRKRIEKIRSIRKVSAYALPERELHIHLDFEKMAMVNTTLDHITRAIQTNNMNIPGGDVSLGATNLSVKSSGSFKDLDEIRNMVINSNQGRLIYLRDVADIDYGYEKQNYLGRFGATRCIFLGISQKEGLNVLETGQDLDPVIEAFKEELPSNMHLEVIYNQPQVVEKRINGFMSNLLQGIVLVGLVIFLSLGFRSSMVVVIAIPLSLIIGLGFVDMAGFGLQQISIAGLVVVLGLLVDNSIVMVENINRHLQLGYSRRKASILAASEIGWPVVTATLTTVLAFVPIAAMPDKAGEFIQSLPVTIALTLTVSLFIALAFTPMIASKLFKEVKPGRVKQKRSRKILTWVIEHPFRRTLSGALKRPGFTMLLGSLFLVGSLAMFPLVGISFFPKAEQANLMVQITLPDGSSLDRTDQVAAYVESVLDTMPEVSYYASNVGHGNPRIYYNVFPKRHDKCFAEIYVQLYHYDNELFAKTVERLRQRFESYPGARIKVKEFEQGPPFDAPVQIYLNGEDLDILREISADVEEMIREEPGAINIENQLVKTNTEMLLSINKEKANMFGVPVVGIDRTIRTAVAGLVVSSFRDPSGEEYRVLLKMDRKGRFGEEELERIYVSSLSGKQHQLKQFVDIQLQQAPSSISRYDMERTAEILADVKAGYTLDDVMDPVLEKLEKYSMPAGYSYTIAGELEGRNDAFKGVSNAVLIAIVSILSVLVLQFRSIRQPLIIFLAIPFAVTGMIWALWITGNTFSFTSFVGLTSLVGIVVNNSIILVDYINKLRERGIPLNEALQQAAETRLTPIVLTALTTIGGLLPLTLQGGTLWAPMGWTIIGGLLVSTILTLVIVPVIYKLLEKHKMKSETAS
jgi:multidrug efflux pump subunit AcrB